VVISGIFLTTIVTGLNPIIRLTYNQVDENEERPDFSSSLSLVLRDVNSI
jgi:hypothetical protein